MKLRWFRVSRNGGRTAVRAFTEQEAIERFAAFNGELSVYPGTTVTEITEHEAYEYYHRIA